MLLRLQLFVCLLMVALVVRSLPQPNQPTRSLSNNSIKSETDSSAGSLKEEVEEVDEDEQALYDYDNEEGVPEDFMSWRGNYDQWSAVREDYDQEVGEEGVVEGPMKKLDITDKGQGLTDADFENIDDYFHDSMASIVINAMEMIKLTKKYIATRDPQEQAELRQQLETLKPKFMLALELSDLMGMNEFYQDFKWLENPESLISNLELTIQLMNMDIIDETIQDDDDDEF